MDIPVIEVSLSRFGQAAEHIADAQAAGQPSVLTIDRTGIAADRAAATGGIPKVPVRNWTSILQLVSEGSAGTSVRAVSPGRNWGPGHILGMLPAFRKWFANPDQDHSIVAISSKFSIFVYNSLLAVFDHSLERPFNEWKDQHVDQGFSWRPRSAAFRTIEDAGPHLVEVRLDISEDEVLQPTRVIEVPFDIQPNMLAEIGSISESVTIELPSALYQLRYECYQYPNAVPLVRLLFTTNKSPIFKIVRADSDLSPASPLLLTAAEA